MGKTEEMLNEFNPLFTLRYSATHKEDFKYNMIYRLDAVDAYNQRLVKKINVIEKTKIAKEYIEFIVWKKWENIY